jgi:hypothetical protein
MEEYGGVRRRYGQVQAYGAMKYSNYVLKYVIYVAVTAVHSILLIRGTSLLCANSDVEANAAYSR